MNPAAALGELARAHGAVGFGIARLAELATDDFLLPRAVLDRLPVALSLALPLQRAVLATLEGRPNQLYEHHYRQTNFALDRLALELARQANKLGGQALPIPASQIVDWPNQRAHLSHKRIAVAAGLGWLGRNNLLVVPGYGAAVRLVTVLTNLELEPTPALHRDCGPCRACIDACPARAVGETAADFRHLDCFAQLKEFQRQRYVSQYICGLCVQVCFGA